MKIIEESGYSPVEHFMMDNTEMEIYKTYSDYYWYVFYLMKKI